VLNGRAIKLPKPEYTRAARDDHAAGMVFVAVTIDERGNVIEAHDMCGSHKALAQSSIEAARRAKFTPTKLSGQPVKVTGIITYNFVIR
jgi:protein TonB